MLALGSVLAAAGVLAAVFASARSCRPKPPEIAQGIQQPAASLAAQRAFEAAEAHAEANPADYAGAIRRYRDVESSYPDTAYAASAASRRTQLEAELDQKARETLDGLKRRSEALIQQGQYADALAALARLPDGLATPAWRERLSAAHAAAERAARQRFDADLARGKAALDHGEPDQALKVYRSLGDSLPPAWRDEAAQRIEAVRQRQRELAEQAKAEKVAAQRRLMAQVGALYRKRDYEGAAQLIHSALEAEPGEYRVELERELDEAGHVQAFWHAAELGAESLIGQPYTVRGMRGQLASVKEGQLTVETPGGTFTQELSALKNSEVVKLAAPMLAPGTAPLETARFLIAQGDFAGAEESLKALEASGTPVADQRARIRRLASAEPQTPTPKPAPQTTANARLRIACDGRYKVYLNGKSVSGGEYREGAFEEIPLTAKSGDVLAVEATSKGSYRSLYALLSVDDGTYAIPTDASWRCSADAAEGWQTDPLLDAQWGGARPAYWPHVKPGYAQTGRGLPGYWIWGRGDRSPAASGRPEPLEGRCFFRKTIQLQKTVAAAEADERAAEKALTAKFGPPAKATLWIACRESYLLYLNGKLAGCAAAFLPQGATYELSVRQGDVVGVQAAASGQSGALEARIEVEGYPHPLRTDRSWVYPATAAPPDDWPLRGTPSGRWRAPDYLDATTHRIWGDGQTLVFRKTLDLKRIEAGRFRRLLYFYGQARLLADGRAEITYDFHDPEQLADWFGDRPWVWAKGGVVGTAGIFYTMPYRIEAIQFDAQIESAGDPALGLWGDDAARGDRYTLSFSDFRQGSAILRRNLATLGMGRGLNPSGTHRVTLSLDPARKKRGEFSVSLDGHRIFDADEETPIPPTELWRVGFRAAPGANTLIGSARITGTPDWARLRTEAARRGGGATPPPEEK